MALPRLMVLERLGLGLFMAVFTNQLLQSQRAAVCKIGMVPT